MERHSLVSLSTGGCGIRGQILNPLWAESEGGHVDRIQPPASAPEAEPTPGNRKGGWKHSGFLPMDLSSGPPGGSAPLQIPRRPDSPTQPQSSPGTSWAHVEAPSWTGRAFTLAASLTQASSSEEESQDPACAGLAMGPSRTASRSCACVLANV